MKKTPLYHAHVQLGAKMVPFAGFEMPVQYEGVTAEHLSVRDHTGAFDVSHMGEFFVSGSQSAVFLQRICSNDIDKLIPGKAQYNYFPNVTGGVIDDLIVYQLSNNHYMLVVNAANIEKDWDWLQKNCSGFDVQLEDRSEDKVLLAIQGPKTLEALQPLTNCTLNKIPYYGHQQGRFAECDAVLIANTGYTGSGGVELYLDRNYATTVWEAILKQGVKPIGLAARDTLRLEMGYCLYGNELNENLSPIAAGLGWVTKPETDCIGASLLQQQKAEGTPQQLVGLKLTERGIPRANYTVLNNEKETIGYITSGTQSPSLKCGIGLAYVKREYAKTNQEVCIAIRNKTVRAKVVKLPFLKPTL
ncbi:MAG: glycine cleavage system aminomethyltransferase GcvT [Flavobacteriaceae bacterium]